MRLTRKKKLTQKAPEVSVLRKWTLLPGDLIHVQLGILDLGDGMPPWIPSQGDMEHTRERWEAALPKDVRVIVTHIGERVDCILGKEHRIPIELKTFDGGKALYEAIRPKLEEEK
jgi:hypothetical protein